MILDLTEAKGSDDERIVGFAFGLISYDKGDIDKLGNKVFLLGPNENQKNRTGLENPHLRSKGLRSCDPSGLTLS